MKLLRPTTYHFMVHKDYKNRFKICLSSMWNHLQDPTPHLFSYQCVTIIVSPSITMFFWSPSQASFLIESSISFWSYIFWSMTCCLQVHLGTLYRRVYLKQKQSPCTLWWCLWWLLQALLLFSYNFDVVYSTFLQVLEATSFSFIISFVTPGRLQKYFWPSFYTSKNQSSLSSLNILHCWFSVSVYLHSSTYTWGW